MPYIIEKSKNPSRNPKGRTKGIDAINPVTLRPYRKEFTEMACKELPKLAPQIIKKAFEMAIAGDQKMITMFWDIFFDPKIDNRLMKKLPCETAEQINESFQFLLDNMSNGELDLEYGTSLLKALIQKKDSIVMKDLEAQVKIIMADKIKDI